MKKTIIGLFLFAGIISATGFGATKVTAQEATSETKFGLGLSSFGTGSTFPSSPALSADIEFGNNKALQILVGINNSDPLDFSVGSVFRYMLVGTNHLGWHVGVGFNLGTAGKTVTVAGSSSDFFVNLLLPTTGLKFSLGGALSNVKLCFDGGMVMHLTPSPFKMYMAPLNGVLGASIHYYF